MAKPKNAETSLRAYALDPLRNFKHVAVSVKEWAGANVIVRALSAGDWAEYRRRATELIARAREDAGLSASPQTVEGDDQLPAEPEVEFNSSALYAFVLTRTLFDESGQCVFGDEDVAAVAEAFSPVHDRLVGKAFELSGVQTGADSSDPVDVAGND